MQSLAARKRTILTGNLSLLTVAICLVFLPIDFFNDRYPALFYEGACAVMALVSWLLNRKGKHTIAKVLLCLSANFTIFVFAESEPIEIGLHMLFVVSAIGALTIFGYEQLTLGISTASLSLLLFLIIQLTDINILPKAHETQEYIEGHIVINFVVCAIAAITVVYFLIDLNYRSEKTLQENESQLSIKNEELSKVNAELDRFVYSTSHDLRSPISSALGLVNLSKMTQDPKEIKLYMTMMEERLLSLNKFIKDISDYSRNTRTEVVKQPVEVRNVISEIITNLKFYPKAEKMEVHTAVAEGFVLQTDPTRLQVILSNLISNSYKYLDPNKEQSFVRISAVTDKSTTRIEVADNGKGIPEKYIHRIFEMFFQAHERVEGSGLGLYIVKEAVQKLGGTISVQSKVDEGSTFTVLLPNS
ncbi:MAG: HAMP domain-containing histidine kinase [Cyclobacteriaceae bacterium]|nr:HAMP domain-containing histidine kinase [Cyclobacteriaceae bacterium]